MQCRGKLHNGLGFGIGNLALLLYDELLPLLLANSEGRT